MVKTSKERMPTACGGKNRWKGNKKPLALVATVVQIKAAVQPLDGLDVRSPNITTNPAKIPSKLNKTCTKVRIVMPKIMSAPFQKKFRSADEGPLTYTRRTQRANRRAERVLWDRFALWRA